MAQKAEFGYVDILLLGLILSLAAGLRTGYLVRLADNGNAPGVYQVQDSPPALPKDNKFRNRDNPTETDELVHNLNENMWFGSFAPGSAKEEPTAHVSPGYPWLLSFVVRAAGDDKADQIVRWLQCALGTLTAAVYFFLALRAFGSRTVATLAGLFCALNPFWIVNVAEINDGVLTCFLLALGCASGARAYGTSGWFSSLLFGLTLAGLCLVRAAMLPFAFVAVLCFFYQCRKLERGWLCCLMVFLGFVNGLVPWTLRNYKVYNQPVPIVDTTYYHLWQGVNPRATGGPQSETVALETLAEQRGESLPQLRKRLEDMDQVARYRSFSEPVVTTVKDRPGDFLQHRLEATLCFVVGEQWLKTHRIVVVVPATRPTPDWITDSADGVFQGTLLALFGLGLIGWRWSLGWRHDAAPTALALIWIPLPYILSHADFLHGPRLPLDGILMLYAAFAVGAMIPGVRGYLLGGRDKLTPAVAPTVQAAYPPRAPMGQYPAMPNPPMYPPVR